MIIVALSSVSHIICKTSNRSLRGSLGKTHHAGLESKTVLEALFCLEPISQNICKLLLVRCV